ncbi:MAG: LytTR family DNA-binding domain-containing protein, partial [Bacteroidota bacterium]
KYMISKNLKEAENRLNEAVFKRVHASYLINLEHVKKYDKADGGYFVMINGDIVPISRRKKQELSSLFEKWQ